MRTAIEINLDVLVLNKGTFDRSLFRHWHLSFLSFSRYRSGIQDALNGSVIPDEKSMGAYLHFTLPRELRTEKDGVFPLIPNRWLVIRTVNNDYSNAKSVIIESDCPGEEGTSVILSDKAKSIIEKSGDACRTKIKPSRTGNLNHINLGKVFDLADWQERAPKDIFLTAAENGDIMFSAYCFRNNNILSYYDSLAGIDRANISYYVAGWISSDENAPLYIASSTDIAWDRASEAVYKDDPYFKDYDAAPINVALGTNTNEAYLALLSQKLKGNPNREKIITGLAAVLGDFTLDKPNAIGITASRRHTAGFAARDSALQFSDIKNSVNAKKINELCEKIEALRRTIYTQRQDLWTDFWRFHFFSYIPRIAKNMTGKTALDYAHKLDPNNVKSVIQPLMGNLAQLNECYSKLSGFITNNMEGALTKRYYKPLSPGLIVSGVNAPKDLDADFNGRPVPELKDDGKCPFNNIPNITGLASALTQLAANKNPHTQPFDPIYMEWRLKYVNIPFENWVFDGIRYQLKSGVSIEDFETVDGRKNFVQISGIAPLNNYFEGFIKDKFSKMENGNIFNMLSFSILSQELAGFTEAVAQRDSRPFGVPTPVDDANDTVADGLYFSNLLGFDNENDDLSPGWYPLLRNDDVHGTPYFALRNGGFRINDLIIYDKFGRKIVFITGTQETGTVYAENFPIILEGSLRGQGHYALLPPAFLQEAALHCRMDLLCFLTHNTVNESIMIHHQDSGYMGDITVKNGLPQWVSDVYGADALPPPVNTLVKNFTDGGLHHYTQVVALIEKRLAHLSQKPADLLSAVLGRPLALMDITLALDFFSEPYSNINWAGDGSEPPYLSYGYPFAAGDPNEGEDGLALTFSGKNYEKITAAGQVPDCTLGIKKETNFLALCAPDTFVTVRTGLLPEYRFPLPKGQYIPQRMDINHALLFKNNEESIFAPMQRDGSKAMLKINTKLYQVATDIKETAKPIIASAVLIKESQEDANV